MTHDRLDFAPTGNATADAYLYRLRAKLLTLPIADALKMLREHIEKTERAAPPESYFFAYTTVISYLNDWLAELRQARVKARAA